MQVRAKGLAALAVTVATGLVLVVAAAANVSPTTIGTDPYTNTTSQHKTAVEPDSFSHSSTIVAAFQLGRFYDGGASNIGWAAMTRLVVNAVRPPRSNASRISRLSASVCRFSANGPQSIRQRRRPFTIEPGVIWWGRSMRTA